MSRLRKDERYALALCFDGNVRTVLNAQGIVDIASVYSIFSGDAAFGPKADLGEDSIDKLGAGVGLAHLTLIAPERLELLVYRPEGLQG